MLTRAFLARLSGDDDLAIPEIHVDSAISRILEQHQRHVPALRFAARLERLVRTRAERQRRSRSFVPFAKDGPGPIRARRQADRARSGSPSKDAAIELASGARVKVPRRPAWPIAISRAPLTGSRSSPRSSPPTP